MAYNYPMTREEFVENRGQKCPFCGSHSWDHGEADVEESGIYIHCDCHECNESWILIYKVSGYMSMEEG